MNEESTKYSSSFFTALKLSLLKDKCAIYCTLSNREKSYYCSGRLKSRNNIMIYEVQV